MSVTKIDRLPSSTNGQQPSATRAPRLRLLKVLIQPVFVLDDGESLVEQVAQPREFPAASWPEPAVSMMAEATEKLRQQIEGT